MATVPGQVTNDRQLGWLVWLIGLSVLLNYVDRGAIGVAAPLMKEELGLSATRFGAAVSAFFWVYAPMCLVVGWLCDRFCVYRVFAAGVALWALATLLTGWVGGLVSLVVLRLLLGTGEAIAFPGSSKIFASEVPASRRGWANAIVSAAIAFGPAVGTLAGGAILAASGWRPIFWVFGAVTLVWLVPWLWAARPYRAAASSRAQADSPVRLAEIARLPAVWLMGAAHFMSNYSFYFLLAWLPLFLTTVRGFSIPEMTAMATAGFIAQGLAALAGGYATDALVRRGHDEARIRRVTMIVCHAVVGAGILGLMRAQTTEAITALLVVVGLATGQIASNIFAIGQMFGGARASGSWIGLQNALGNVSGMVGPVLTGVIIDRLGSYDWAFAASAGVGLLGALWWAFVIPPIREIALKPGGQPAFE